MGMDASTLVLMGVGHGVFNLRLAGTFLIFAPPNEKFLFFFWSLAAELSLIKVELAASRWSLQRITR
jgi:hypothetical protein